MEKLDWDSSDWMKAVQHWTNQSLIDQGLVPLGKLERVSGWALGLILKQKTQTGWCFFKSTAFLPLFSNEAQVCQILSKRLPNHVPKIINTAQRNQWMLSDDFGGGLPETTDKNTWGQAFKAFANFQQQSVDHIDELMLNGCLSRPIAKIPAQLGELLKDRNIIASLPKDIGLNKERLLLTVTKAIEELERFNLPNTIVHGDLHIENIAKNQEDFIFFDWSDACISHPFIDGTYIFRMPNSMEKRNIIEAYLSQWTHLADINTLVAAWNKAEIVCYAHQAVTYGSMKNALKKEQMQDLEQAYLNAYIRLFNLK